MNSIFKEIHENFRVIVTISFSQRQFVKFHFMLQYIVFFVSSWHFSHFILFLVISNTVSIDLTFMAFITFTPYPKTIEAKTQKEQKCPLI